MNGIKNHLFKASVWTKIWLDDNGQDLIEYSLMAGFVATAAGALMPGVATSISTIFSKISCVMSYAAAEPIAAS